MKLEDSVLFAAFIGSWNTYKYNFLIHVYVSLLLFTDSYALLFFNNRVYFNIFRPSSWSLKFFSIILSFIKKSEQINMEYIKAAVVLKKLIEKANQEIKAKNSTGFDMKNLMIFSKNGDDIETQEMDVFTNGLVNENLKKNPETKAFVITDVATNEVQHKFITYFLYKAYHKSMEKGLFFYQKVNPKTMEFQGDLQFSNLEQNIFLKPDLPAFEESSCNAMETDKHTKEQPEVVFLIGNMNEERLVYDIRRLIVETAFNVLKNTSVKYNFIVHISRFGDAPSNELKNSVKDIEKDTKQLIEQEFPNTTFSFEWE